MERARGDFMSQLQLISGLLLPLVCILRDVLQMHFSSLKKIWIPVMKGEATKKSCSINTCWNQLPLTKDKYSRFLKCQAEQWIFKNITNVYLVPKSATVKGHCSEIGKSSMLSIQDTFQVYDLWVTRREKVRGWRREEIKCNWLTSKQISKRNLK